MIDAHQHFWRYEPATHGWIGPAMHVLKRDFMPEDLRTPLTAAGARGCIAVQAAQTLDETRFLLALADQYPWIVGVVGWVDLHGRDLEAQLAEFTENSRFVGVRHLAQDEPDDGWLARSETVRGIARLGRLDLAYDLLVHPRQLPAAIELVRALPEQRFVLDHLGKPEIRSSRIEPWRTLIRELARSENVVAKLSGLVTEADWSAWTSDDLKSYVEVALDAFGPGRLMIGSDWPVCLAAGEYERVVAAEHELIAGLGNSEREAVLERTAVATYLGRGAKLGS